MNPAIVKFPKTGGRGVLVGQFIITAAHCITFHTDGRMLLDGGRQPLHEVLTQIGTIKCVPVAVECCSDLAVMGVPDYQIYEQEPAGFDRFVESTTPFSIACDTLEAFKPFPIAVLDADETWLKGCAEICQSGSNLLSVTTPKQLSGGASGGPILNSKGELIAVVSNSPNSGAGLQPMLCESLPVWVLKTILNSH